MPLQIVKFFPSLDFMPFKNSLNCPYIYSNADIKVFYHFLVTSLYPSTRSNRFGFFFNPVIMI